MSFESFQRVALRRNLSEHGLRAGDIGTVVEIVPHPRGGETGYVLEIFNAIGESLRTIIVPSSDIEPLRQDELLTVRSLNRAG